MAYELIWAPSARPSRQFKRLILQNLRKSAQSADDSLAASRDGTHYYRRQRRACLDAGSGRVIGTVPFEGLSEGREMIPQIAQIDADSKDPETHAIIGAAMEVHRQMGPGFLEAVYQEAMAIELTDRGIPYEREKELPVDYKGRRLPCRYRADFVCYDDIIVELKAQQGITGTDEAQLLNYLKATHLERGLLLNFGRPSLQFQRLIFQNLRKSAQSAD